MLVSKNLSFAKVLRWTAHHLLWLTLWAGLVTWLYRAGLVGVTIPWLPISVLGTAVAFYVGFKNNQAYERTWEARKIWGAIVNDSRTWGMMVDGFVTDFFVEDKALAQPLGPAKRRLVRRHIAWLYTLRAQLLVPKPWEHASQPGFVGRIANVYRRTLDTGPLAEEVARVDVRALLPPAERERVFACANPAAQLLNAQSRDLHRLRVAGLVEDFRHMEMAGVLAALYADQGAGERIKNFPLPRQYANVSRYFVGIFLFLFPFSMVPELLAVSHLGAWIAVPITVLVGWIYVMMEIVGDYSENPFAGLANDIPMLSLCRGIEIDLLEMLGEEKLPAQVRAQNGVLM